MTHRNAPLSIEGRRRLVERCRSRPIAHVAAEMGISRACASKWVNRWRLHGDAGLLDRSSTPHRSPNATPASVIEQIETWRRGHKWSAQRITDELADLGHDINRRTVTRHLTRLGLGRRRFLDPAGDNNRKPGKIIARWPGHMVHLDVKKVGRIPDGGGWRIHGRDSDQAKAAGRAKSAGARRGTPTCTPPSTGSPGCPTRNLYPTKREPPRQRSSPAPRSGSQPTASPTYTDSSPTTVHATDPATSPGSWASSPGTRRPGPTHLATMARWSATSAFWAKSCSTPGTSSARTPDRQRSLSGTSTTTTIDHTQALAVSRQHPDCGKASPTSSPRTPSLRRPARRRAAHRGRLPPCPDRRRGPRSP